MTDASLPHPSARTGAALSEDDYNTLDQIFDDMRQRQDEVPQWEFCEGYMAALICCRRPIPADEYLAALLSDPDTGNFGPALFASPEQYEQFLHLWQRRWNEVSTALDAPVDNLDDERAYVPEVIDLRGAVAAMSEAERATMHSEMGDEALPSFAQVWALGFMYAVETWPEEWAPPRDKEAAQWMQDAMARIVALTEDDTAPASLSMLGEDSPPSLSQERLDAYAQAVWAVYDLRDIGKSLGPRVEQVINPDTPGRNDPCHCGSGKKFKKCCGA